MANVTGPIGAASKPSTPAKQSGAGTNKVDISGNRLVNPARQTAATPKGNLPPAKIARTASKAPAKVGFPLIQSMPEMPTPSTAWAPGRNVPMGTPSKPAAPQSKPIGASPASKPPSVMGKGQGKGKGVEGKSDVRKNPVEGKSDSGKASNPTVAPNPNKTKSNS